jgi:hypothetical protein
VQVALVHQLRLEQKVLIRFFQLSHLKAVVVEEQTLETQLLLLVQVVRVAVEDGMAEAVVQVHQVKGLLEVLVLQRIPHTLLAAAVAQVLLVRMVNQLSLVLVGLDLLH